MVWALVIISYTIFTQPKELMPIRDIFYFSWANKKSYFIWLNESGRKYN